MHRPSARGLRCLLVLPLLAALACQPAAPPVALPDLLIASGWLTRVASPAGTVLAQRFLPTPATDLALSADGTQVAVAMHDGAAVFRTDDLSVVWTEQLDIVDAVVFHPAAPLVYVLVHPGDDPHEVAADHFVLEIELPEGTHRRRLPLDRRSFDLAIAADGSALLVTDLIGRQVHHIDLGSGDIETHRFLTGAPPSAEPRQAMFRCAVPVADGWLVPEDDRSRIHLWRLDGAGVERLPFATDIQPPILGGAALPEAVWLHGRQHLLRLTDDGSIADSHRIAKRDDEGPYRFADFAADGRLAVLVAPGPRVQHGPPRAYIQFWDLTRGERLSRRLVETFAGPCVMVPPVVAESLP